MIIEAIPYKNFREKTAIVNKYLGKAKIEILENYIYIERYEELA